MSLRKALRNARKRANYEIGVPPREAETLPAPAEPCPAIPINESSRYPIGTSMEVDDGHEA